MTHLNNFHVILSLANEHLRYVNSIYMKERHMGKLRSYLCLDLKSFYASVECIERGLDPIKTNLVVADESRTDKSICLAVTPAIKSLGINGRPRLFEVKQKINEINRERLRKNGGPFRFKSCNIDEVKNENVEIGFIVATPRMAHYILYSTKVYEVYCKTVSRDDMHIYSVDEVFMDITSYLSIYKCTPYELAEKMIKDVLSTTGITATAGIGTNPYLAKVAMDIVAKHVEADENGIRIATLDEISYRELLWNHRPLTDFWRVGRGYEKKLEQYNLMTMGDIARCSIEDEELLYKLFGINAELLIDHAWGEESCTMKHIKEYKPEFNSLGSGQVLHCAYTAEAAKIVLKEMVETMALSLTQKRLMTKQLTLYVGYDVENCTDASISKLYQGEIKVDSYGRKVPKHSSGVVNLKIVTSSEKLMVEAMIKKFNEIVNPILLIRRISISANKLQEETFDVFDKVVQLDLFHDTLDDENKRKKEILELKEEYQVMKTVNDIKKRYGKNKILKASSLLDEATQKERNEQIGGHKA